MIPYYILLGMMVISYLGHNLMLVKALGILLVIKIFLPPAALAYFGGHGLNWGIIVLTSAMLVPIATGAVGIPEIVAACKSPLGIWAIFVGVFVAVLGRFGIDFMQAEPDMIPALMIGTILGVFFLKGVPVGPLIASGFVFGSVKLLRLVLGLFN